jgi:hypothetical protein
MGTSVESCMQRMQQPAPKGYSSLLRYVRYSEFEQTMYPYTDLSCYWFGLEL